MTIMTIMTIVTSATRVAQNFCLGAIPPCMSDTLRFNDRSINSVERGKSMESGMNLGWLDWSNPVAIWWAFLVAVSAANVAVLLSLYLRYRNASGRTGARVVIE